MRVLDLQMLKVKKILNDYNLKDHYLEVKEWYDGYHFGNIDIYWSMGM